MLANFSEENQDDLNSGTASSSVRDGGGCRVESVADFFTGLTMVNLQQQTVQQSSQANLEDDLCVFGFEVVTHEKSRSLGSVQFVNIPLAFAYEEPNIQKFLKTS